MKIDIGAGGLWRRCCRPRTFVQGSPAASVQALRFRRLLDQPQRRTATIAPACNAETKSEASFEEVLAVLLGTGRKL